VVYRVVWDWDNAEWDWDNAEGVRQFQPKVWSAATTLGSKMNNGQTLKALGLCGNNPYRVEKIIMTSPQGWSAATTLGSKMNNGQTLKALDLCGNNRYRV